MHALSSHLGIAKAYLFMDTKNVDLSVTAGISAFPREWKATRTTASSLQLLIVCYECYEEWLAANPFVKTPESSFPSVSFGCIGAGFREERLSPLDTKTLVSQFRWLSDNSLVLCRKNDETPGFTGCHVTHGKGMTLYHKLKFVDPIPNCSVRDLITDSRNNEVCEALVVYAYLGDECLDSEISGATGLSMNAIERARKQISEGFVVRHPRTNERLKVQATLLAHGSNNRNRVWQRVIPEPVVNPTPLPLTVPDETTTSAVGLVTPFSSPSSASLDIILPSPLEKRLTPFRKHLNLPDQALIEKFVDLGLRPFEEKIALLQAKQEEAAHAEAVLRVSSGEVARAEADLLQSFAQTVLP